MTRKYLVIPVTIACVVLALALSRLPADDVAPPKVPAAGPINVMDSGTVKGDGQSDDAPAIQAILDANPGRAIVFPDRRPSPVPDYFLGATLVLKGSGQSIRGEADGWAERPTLRFAAGVTGIMTDNRACPAAAITDLALQGSESWWGAYAAEAVLPFGFGGAAGASTADGIRIRANFVRVERCSVQFFGRHGINVGSDDIDQDAAGDSFYIACTYLGQNRGCGLHIQGGDSNAGTTVQVRTTANQLWGIYDRSFLGNTHITPVAHGNHYDGTPGKAATKVWEAAGDAASGGPYRGADTSNIGNTWISPYAEGDQPPSRFGSRDQAIGGDLGSGTTGRHFWLSTTRDVVGSYATPFLWMTSADDFDQWLVLKPGKTQAANAIISVVNPDNSARWDEVRGANGRGWEWWEGEQGKGKLRIKIAPGGPVTIDGKEVKPGDPGPPGKDGQDGHDGKDGKDGMPGKDGAVGPAGPPGVVPPRVRVEDKATIPAGKTMVVVEHGLGGRPYPEDTRVVMWGAARVWLAGVDFKTLTFRTDRPAPAAGITFTYAASRQP